MAPGERENPYEGLGTGGKFRKRPFRRTQTTPYDRPSTSLTIPNGDNNINNNGWFSKVVNPAHKLITYSARSIFSSLFRKRLPPQSQSQSPSETEQEVRNNHLEESAFVSINSSGKKQVTFGNGESDAQINCSDGGGLTELEKLLRQKTFTRSEIDHLTALMRSRTVDTPIREEEKRTEVVPSKPMLFSERKDEDPKTPIVENRIEDRLPLTPYVTSSVPIEDVASPAELAKAYMGSRPSATSKLNSQTDPYTSCFLDMPTVTGKSIALLSLITSYGLSKSNSTLKVHYCTRTVHEMENTLAQLKLLHHYQDLRAFGKEKGWCPYFLTRHVCSLRLWWTGGYIYQYLLDPKMAGIISKEMQKESVVVFDEAHNMISMMFVLKHLL